MSKKRNLNAQQDGSGPIVVIIRHGKTEYNKLGLFTGEYESKYVSFLKQNSIFKTLGKTIFIHS